MLPRMDAVVAQGLTVNSGGMKSIAATLNSM